MGMLGHYYHVAVVFKDKNMETVDEAFDNEADILLSDEADLFKNVETIDDLRRDICAAFKSELDGFSFEDQLEDVGIPEYFDSFIETVGEHQIEEISAVVVIADHEMLGQREYEWRKYSLRPYGVADGKGYGTFVQGSYDNYTPSAEEYLKNTIIPTKCKAPSYTPGSDKRIVTDSRKKSEEAANKSTASAHNAQGWESMLKQNGFKSDVFDPKRIKNSEALQVTKISDNTHQVTGGSRPHIVLNGNGFFLCDCPDFGEVPKNCKHIIAVRRFINDPLLTSAKDPTPIAASQKPSYHEDTAYSRNIFASCVATTEDDYLIDGDMIRSYYGDAKNIILPRARNLRKISSYAFDDVVKVVIPDNYTDISESAFYNCDTLESVKLPAGLKAIEKDVFSYCGSLKEIVIPEGCECIGGWAFSDCKSLERIRIPESCTKIGNSAFEGCENLQEVHIQSCTEIGGNAFEGCTSLKEIVIPAGCTNLGYQAFANCSALERITLPDDFKELDSNAFEDCPKLKHISVGYNTDYPFEYEMYGIIEIRKKDLSSVDISAPINAASCVLPNAEDLQIEDGVLKKYTGSQPCIILPSTIRKIGSGAFYYTPVEQIIIPDECCELEEQAFWYCRALERIHLPNSLRSLPDDAFYECGNLLKVTIPDGCTEIGKSAFRSCENLREVDVPDSVQKIGEYAFWKCEKLEKVSISDGCTCIEKGTFWGCKNLKNVSIPASLQKIGERAFCSCEKLQELVLPECLENIDDWAFSYCYALQRIDFLGNSINIGKHVFDGCNALRDVYVNKEMKIRKTSFTPETTIHRG